MVIFVIFVISAFFTYILMHIEPPKEKKDFPKIGSTYYFKLSNKWEEDARVKVIDIDKDNEYIQYIFLPESGTRLKWVITLKTFNDVYTKVN